MFPAQLHPCELTSAHIACDFQASGFANTTFGNPCIDIHPWRHMQNLQLGM